MSSAPSTAPFISAFDAFASAGGSGAASWLGDLRRRALSRFEAQGLPTRKLDGWKYTGSHVGSVANSDLAIAELPATLPSADALDATGFGALDASLVTVVDGIQVDSLSNVGDLPAGVFVGSLARALRERPELADQIESHLGDVSEIEGEAFAALNNAFLRDGVLVHLPRGTVLEKPVHVRFVATSSAARHPRCVLILEENSEAVLFESFVAVGIGDGDSNSGYVDNAVTQISLATGARLRHLRLQDEAPGAYHLATLRVSADRDSDYRAQLISTGAKVARTALYAHLQGPGASVRVTGLNVVTGKQHQDTFVLIDHAAPHCTSDILFKKVLDDSATSVFNAKVLVRKDAQKTDARQQNRNLLLSERSTANTLPQLEIYADDVKCAHGATVGQLDPDQIFYMRARGIGLEEARRELTFAFAREILDGVDHDVARERLGELVRRRFDAGGTA